MHARFRMNGCIILHARTPQTHSHFPAKCCHTLSTGSGAGARAVIRNPGEVGSDGRKQRLRLTQRTPAHLQGGSATLSCPYAPQLRSMCLDCDNNRLQVLGYLLNAHLVTQRFLVISVAVKRRNPAPALGGDKATKTFDTRSCGKLRQP